jgi:hypothetical protein
LAKAVFHDQPLAENQGISACTGRDKILNKPCNFLDYLLPHLVTYTGG